MGYIGIAEVVDLIKVSLPAIDKNLVKIGVPK